LQSIQALEARVGRFFRRPGCDLQPGNKVWMKKAGFNPGDENPRAGAAERDLQKFIFLTIKMKSKHPRRSGCGFQPDITHLSTVFLILHVLISTYYCRVQERNPAYDC